VAMNYTWKYHWQRLSQCLVMVDDWDSDKYVSKSRQSLNHQPKSSERKALGNILRYSGIEKFVRLCIAVLVIC
jgi:hypothetical protein